MSFTDLGLKPELLRAVDEKGYSVPTPIQSQAIPAVLAGGDVLAGAQTGTGKTAAFILPILQNLGTPQARSPRALVLTPTRELAAQVAESARSYGKYVGLRTVVVFGGVSINPQIDSLDEGCDLLVATPGRLLDLAEQGCLDLQDVRCFVLDEADRMLDMGFIHAIRRVLKLLPQQRQNLMFSATYSDEIRQLAARFLRNPARIEVAARNATADRVDQQIYRVQKEHKRHLLAHLIDSQNWFQVLVFTRTKHGANRLAQQLESNGIQAAAIHGNKSQGARVRALSDFKANKITALVATEVAARGLDIKELPHVVNYELPNVPEDYVHRIGRTARAGGSGSAVSLVSPDEAPLLKDIERMLNRALPVAALPDFPLVTVSDGDRRQHRGTRLNGQQVQQDDGRSSAQQAQDAQNAEPRRDQHAPGGERDGRHVDQHSRDTQHRGPRRGQPGQRGQRDGRHADQRAYESRHRGPRGGQRGPQGQRDAQQSGDQRGGAYGDQRGRDGQHRAGHGDQRGRDGQQGPGHGDQRGREGQHGAGHGDQRGREGQHGAGYGDQRGRDGQRGTAHGDQRGHGGGQHGARHGDQRGRPGQHSGRRGGAGVHPGGEGSHGRGEFRRGRSSQSSGFAPANRAEPQRQSGGRSGGRRG